MQRFFRLGVVLFLFAALAPAARAGWWQDVSTIKRGLNQAVATGWITSDEAADYRSILGRATSTWRRLPGSRSTNLAGVLHDVALQSQSYIAPRALTLFTMLDTNTTYLGSDALPAAGKDVLDDDGVVYRSFPGQGLQFHPLGNFARLNSLLARGDDTDAGFLASALLDRAIPRKGGKLVWEYYFPFGGGRPPWTSGMVQAVAARAYAGMDDMDDARKAYLALSGLTFPLSAGPWVRLYSFSNEAVLNAQLQAAVSLSIYGNLAQDEGAATLSQQLLQSASTLWPRFDTGAWSLYELGGNEAPLKYHAFVVTLLKRIAAMTQDPVWQDRAVRFASYLTQPPVLSLRPLRAAVRRTARISLWLSKISYVTLTIAGGSSSYTLARGFHSFYWSARGRRSGRYVARVSAVDLAGNKAVKKIRFVVRRPPVRRPSSLR
jgi:hypothetical protein